MKELLNTNSILKKISTHEIPLDLKKSNQKHHSQENKKQNIKFRSRCTFVNRGTKRWKM